MLQAFALLTGVLFATGAANAQPVVDAARTRPLLALKDGLRPAVLKPDEPLPRWSLRERMAHYNVPGVAIAILRNGEVVDAVGYGVRESGTHEAITADTLFSVGSISKVITAAASLRLVAQGKIDLDRDVNTYFKTWRIPQAARLDHPVVTMRMLMSHTAGLNVHGFKDYLPGESLPTLLDTLNGKPPAKNDAVRLQRQPGLLGDYSGGGVMVEQLVIEDVTGMPLEDVARAEVFGPVGMRRSTFANPLPADRGNIAKAHDDDGAGTTLTRGWESFPEQAASGLWTSASELGGFVGALIKSYQGSGTFLPRATATQMMTEVSPSGYGLGPRLDGAGATRIFHHGGANDSYHAWIEGYLESGDGFVILTNGANGQRLHAEIRNALSDALGHGVNPPLRTVDLGGSSPAHADYGGAYRLDPVAPLAHRRTLADTFDYDEFEVDVGAGAGALVLSLAGRPEPLTVHPLTQTRFVTQSGAIQFEFHRDAHGMITAVSVEQGASRAYYRRQALVKMAAR